MDGANAFGATSSNNYGGTISKYYDRNEDKKNKGDKKEKKFQKIFLKESIILYLQVQHL